MLSCIFQLPLVACLAASTVWAANDPFVGKWKVNPMHCSFKRRFRFPDTWEFPNRSEHQLDFTRIALRVRGFADVGYSETITAMLSRQTPAHFGSLWRRKLVFAIPGERVCLPERFSFPDLLPASYRDSASTASSSRMPVSTDLAAPALFRAIQDPR